MKKCLVIAIMLIMSASNPLWADDVEIYGTVTNPGLEPNILIIFDSSGSMDTIDVPGDPYDPATAYAGSWPANGVYERYWDRYSHSYLWQLFADDVDDLNCDSAKADLLSDGYSSRGVRAFSFTCGGSTRRLRLGNFMNYDESGVGESKSRIQVAKEVVGELINNTGGVRFGIMRFNPDQGGRIIAPIGADKTTLLNQINAISAENWTPLAETLAEAGLYFAGMSSWFNSGVTYTSPMQERCQRNYIIIMTDGEPTQDIDHKLVSGSYINGGTIGDYDNDGNDPGYYASYGSDYLDDVAKYLYENDCNPTLGDGTAFDKQNIVTFTIGFKVNNQLLHDTAVNGGGEYFTADNISELSMAFDQIISTISEENAVFVAPVVPISRMNRTYAGDKIYLGFFKPQQSGRWIGNIKRYALDNDGILYDVTGAEACTADGLIKDNALSYWTTLGNDGPDVEKGGVAEVLDLLIESPASRNLYTYTGSATALTDASNAFVAGNAHITPEDLGVASEVEKQNLINSVHNGGLGDIIHSEPAVVYYADPDGNPVTDDAKSMIYVGANDGLLHCFDDDDGSEVWGFIPPDQLGRISLLANADHDYFVDGSPQVYYGTDQKILFVGDRRGGDHYMALDITSPDSPRWLYSIGPNILDPDEILGQSWSKPEIATVVTHATIVETGSPPACSVTIDTNVQNVFLLAGGYDNNQDLGPPSNEDSVGRAVFAVRVTDGQLISGLNFNAVNHASLGMTHSIVDVTGIDHDGDGIVSRIYAGDLGGNIFVFRDDELRTFCDDAISRLVVDGTWTSRKLFSASDIDFIQRKIFYAPDVVEEDFGEYVFFGTGDRADPGETGVENRLYAVKNDWNSTQVLNESDLVDVTDDLIQLGNAAEKQATETSLENSQGWFIRLENPGEKVVAAPRVYGGVVYFTTYTPDTGTGEDPEDPCEASTVRGVAQMYAVNYKSGASIHEFSSEVETDHEGHVVNLGKKDRLIAIGTAIPSAPVIAILAGGARIFVGVEGGIVSLPAILTQGMYRYYWHQLF
jgi:type IV pilus assembly protein PilY1